MEQKEKKKKKSSATKGERIPEEQETVVTENEDSNMAWLIFRVIFQVIFSYYSRETRISLSILQVSSSNESSGFWVNAAGFLLLQKSVRIQQAYSQNALITHKSYLLLKLKSFK